MDEFFFFNFEGVFFLNDFFMFLLVPSVVLQASVHSILHKYLVELFKTEAAV